MATKITAEQAKEIAKLSKHEGRLRLAMYLQWNTSDYDEEVNMRGVIHLEYLHDTLMFSATRGFPWQHVVAVMDLAEEFISKTVVKGIDINQAIAIYKLLVTNYLDQVGEKNLKIFTDYMFSTFMAHYKLYLYVFTRPREPQTSQCHLEVEIPPDIMILKDGKPEHIWQYEQKFKSLEDEEEARMNALQAHRESLMEKQNAMEQTVMESIPDGAPLQQEVITELIKNITEEKASHTEKILQTKVEEKIEDLDFYLQKTSLPRPPELGPPPRTKDPPRWSAKSKPPTRGTGAKTGLSEVKSVKSMRSKTPAKAVKT